MSQTMNQMLALIDRVIKGEEPAPTATQALRAKPMFIAGPSKIILLEYTEYDAEFLEQSRDQRARDWLASLPAAKS